MSTSPPTVSQPLPMTHSTPPPDTTTTGLSPGPISSRRRSPPLPKLDLNDCKPIVETTTTNTSTNAAYKPSTAFVFTSSRTLKNLHNYQSPRREPNLLPPAEISHSPTHEDRTSSTGGGEASRKQGRDKPTLSPAQLARHSSGALDARCIVSSSMRAAGFVPLTHSPSSVPSTPMVATVPTPKDPPRFPPVIFVNPHVSGAPLWDYQRKLAYGLGQGPSIGLGFTSRDVSSRTSATATAAPSAPPTAVQNEGPDHQVETVSQTPSRSVSASHSYSSMSSESISSLFSSTSQSSSVVTSLPTSPTSPSRVLKPLHERFEQYSQEENGTLSVYKDDVPGVDGYPFPRQRHSLPGSTPHAEQVCQSPVQATASGSVTPLAQSPLERPTVLPTPILNEQVSTNPQRPNAKPIQYKPPSFKSKAVQEQERKQKLREAKHAAKGSVSITELCSDSPFAWYTNAFVPPSSGPNFSIGTGSSSSSSLGTSSSGSSRRPSAAHIPAKSAISTNTSEVANAALSKVFIAEESEQEKMASGLDGNIEVVDAEKHVEVSAAEQVKDEDTGSEDGGRRGRRRDRDRDREIEREKRQELRKLRSKMKELDLDAVDGMLVQSPSLASSTGSSPLSESGSVKTKRSTNSKKSQGKTRASTTTSHAMFPPKDAQSSAERAHTLGSYDAAMTKERKRDAGEAVKDQVLAHRERDREQARLANQWSLSDDEVRQKKHALTLADMVSMQSDSATAESHVRGRGRGRRERHSMRGRSVSSAASVVSDAETMVGDTGPASQIDTIVQG